MGFRATLNFQTKTQVDSESNVQNLENFAKSYILARLNYKLGNVRNCAIFEV